MQIFKAYFKVLYKNRMSMMIYFIMFIVIAVLVMNAIKSQMTAVFNETKSNIAIFNDDSDSPLTDGLRTYLGQNAMIVRLADNTESIQDALFYGNVSYVLRIPSGFTQSLISGTGDIKLQKTTSATASVSMNLDLLINKYLNIATLYEKSMPNTPQSDIVRHVLNDLSVSSTIDFNNSKQLSDISNLSYYFRFNAYTILAVLIMGIMTIMLTFNEADISRRNLCSPLSPMKMNFQMFLGNATFALAIWAVLCIVNFALFGSIPTGLGIVLLCVNLLIFTIVSLSLGFVFGKFIKSNIAMAAVTNVVSLGLCFLSGVFVDQEALSGTIQTIASFTPSYWYMKAVNGIRDMSVDSAHNLQPIYNDMLIQLAFAAAFIIIALVANKQKKQSTENYVM